MLLILKEYTIIIISHRNKIIKEADYIITMKNGTIFNTNYRSSHEVILLI